MQLIKMIAGAELTELVGAVPIEGYTSVTWVERYQEPGEFKIIAPLSSGLMEFLPVKTFISHVDTSELMWVETHNIKEVKGKDTTIEISGRSFVSYLEERIIGQNSVAGGNPAIQDYQVDSDDTWEQVQFLIYDHLFDGVTVDPDDSLPGMSVDNTCTGTGTQEHRHIKYGTVWDRVKELLPIDDIGIRMVRPTPTVADTYFRIYQGVDRTKTIKFSSLMGDLDNIEYLITHKREKNFMRVVGRWVTTVDGGAAVNLNRRYAMMDGSYLDQQFDAMPAGGTLSLVQAAMVIKGREELAKYKNMMITQADVSANGRYVYGVDYGLGDLVTIDANFDISQVMRVTEIAIIEDEDGIRSHPTLSVLEDN